ncbi:MAG: DNA internalization-related competence protein ComEC/Rec2 [Desulfobacteraceae bacterium 4572_123]|nr:MAG: DNA internalization-related competence protein ComEC/Rec2 [Desulfobacteraceae bacterium 4572_123]
MMTDKKYHRPILPLLIAMMAGISLGAALPGHAVIAWTVISVCMVTVAWIFFYAGGKPGLPVVSVPAIATGTSLVLFLALGYLAIGHWTAPAFPDNHVKHFSDNHYRRISGTIVSRPVIRSYARKFVLSARSLTRDDRCFPVTGKIRVTVGGHGPDLAVGDIISFRGKLKSLHNFNNPGGFNYRGYMALQKIWCSTYTRGKNIVLLDTAPSQSVGLSLIRMRERLARFIDESVQERSGSILKALLIGDRSGITDTVRNIFNRAGVGHLLAISGLHIGIVATVAFYLFKHLLSFWPFFLRRAWTKKGAALLSMLPVIGYALIAGMSPSTQRAVIMICVFLMTFWVEREQDPLNTLAIAACLILICFPPALFSISFQLSFTAVLAIILGLPFFRLPETVNIRPWYRIMRKMAVFFGVTLIAILGTLPLTLYYFNQVSLMGLLANWIAVPLIGFMVVPLGLTSLCFYPFTPQIASMGIDAAGIILGKALYFLELIAGLPFAAVRTITPSIVEIGCYYIFFLAVFNMRSGRWAKAMAMIALFTLGADITYWAHERFRRNDFRTTIIDVGQGSAALLEFPRGYCMLIDGGGFSDNSSFDVGEKIIAPFLWSRKIKTIETIVLSHPNSDHLNGLLYIAGQFNVKNVWSNHQAAKTMGYARFTEIIETNSIQWPDFGDIPRTSMVNGVKVQILYPPEDFMDDRLTWRNLNNNSLVLRCAYGSKSILFPGDIEAPAEKELVGIYGADLESSVLVAPHHGSKTSSTDMLLVKTDPDAVVISAGWNNRFHFPHQAVLKKYQTRGCRIYRTDLNGAVTITTDGRMLDIDPFI